MKILCIIPPYIPSYFNAGHHLPVFQVGNYLRHKLPDASVTCIDGAALNFHWKDVCDLVIQQFDFVCLMNDYDGVDTFRRFIQYVRELSPGSKIVTFGRLSKEKPTFFRTMDVDGIVASGDYESGVDAYIKYEVGSAEAPQGVLYRDRDGAFLDGGPGMLLDSEQWVLPNVEDIPYTAYDRMYQNDGNKFCGIPNCRELVVPVARGCPIGCSYCDVPIMQGRAERRMSVSRVVEYIENAFRSAPFQYVAFYAPTFTLNRNWVLQLCTQLQSLEKVVPWKCATTLHHLDRELVIAMAASGCVRISIGLEALDPNAQSSLPRIKRNTKQKFEELAEWCRESHIELNCFVILGLPGGDLDGVRHTVEEVLGAGARVRPTLYTPYNLISDQANDIDIADFNRQIFSCKVLLADELKMAYYKLFYCNPIDRDTSVDKRVKELYAV